MLKRAVLLKVISWLVFSPTLAVAGEMLHCRADVRAAMVKSWMTVDDGRSNYEAVFLIREDGSIDYRGTDREWRRSNLVKIPAGTIAIFHTHPNDGDAGLSRADKAVADQNGVFVYVISNKGLYDYSMPTGQKLLRPDMQWEKPCN
jgi:hypothetical protein